MQIGLLGINTFLTCRAQPIFRSKKFSTKKCQRSLCNCVFKLLYRHRGLPPLYQGLLEVVRHLLLQKWLRRVFWRLWACSSARFFVGLRFLVFKERRKPLRRRHQEFLVVDSFFGTFLYGLKAFALWKLRWSLFLLRRWRSSARV